MTKLKLERSSPDLSKVALASLEKLCNELSKSSLKALIANQITVDSDSLTSFYENVYVRAKVTFVMRHMLSAGQTDIAVKYLKKAIFDHNRNFRLQAMLLEKAAKLMISSTSLPVGAFTRQVLRDVALDHVTQKTFEHLKTGAMLNNLPVDDTVAIHEAKLASAGF